MHQQGCVKLRCIDSGKKPKHNEASLETETIFTTSVDFIPAAVHAVLWYVLGTVQRLRYDDIDTLADLSLYQLLGLLPAWLVFELGTEDMKNAYRQNPVHPDHYRFVTVAFWHYLEQAIMFLVLLGSPFRLSSAVLNFNRTPALQTAVLRRCLGVLSTHFYDHFGIVDVAAAHGTAQAAVRQAFTLAGLQLDPEKGHPMYGQRVFLGQVLDVARAAVTGSVQFTLKPGFREAMNAQIDGVFNEARLGSGFAAKLRGQFGWASTTVHGKCGRGAQAALIQRQFFDVSEELTLPLQHELLFHKLLHALWGHGRSPLCSPRCPLLPSILMPATSPSTS